MHWFALHAHSEYTKTWLEGNLRYLSNGVSVSTFLSSPLASATINLSIIIQHKVVLVLIDFHDSPTFNSTIFSWFASFSVDKSKILSLVLHCCDVAHPSKPWLLHRHWTDLLLEEFFRQGDNEKELGLPYSPLCDRNNTLVAESQIGTVSNEWIESIIRQIRAQLICSFLDCVQVLLSSLWSQLWQLWVICWIKSWYPYGHNRLQCVTIIVIRSLKRNAMQVGFILFLMWGDQTWAIKWLNSV